MATTTVTASGTPATGDQKPSVAAHTPGPWDWDFKSDRIDVWSPLPGSDKAIIAELHYADVFGRTKEVEANAHLIAAAPDMLEALRRAEQFITNGIELGFIRMPDADCPDPAHQTPGIIRAAIAKATGESARITSDAAPSNEEVLVP